MPTYEQFVKELKTKARDLRRINAMARFITERVSIKETLQNLENQLNKVNLQVEINEYKLNKLDPQDPQYEAKKKSLEKYLKTNKEFAEDNEFNLTQRIKQTKKNLERIETKIADLEEGKVLMNEDPITSIVQNWLRTTPFADVPEFEGSNKGQTVNEPAPLDDESTDTDENEDYEDEDVDDLA